MSAGLRPRLPLSEASRRRASSFTHAIQPDDLISPVLNMSRRLLAYSRSRVFRAATASSTPRRRRRRLRRTAPTAASIIIMPPAAPSGRRHGDRVHQHDCWRGYRRGPARRGPGQRLERTADGDDGTTDIDRTRASPVDGHQLRHRDRDRGRAGDIGSGPACRNGRRLPCRPGPPGPAPGPSPSPSPTPPTPGPATSATRARERRLVHWSVTSGPAVAGERRSRTAPKSGRVATVIR